MHFAQISQRGDPLILFYSEDIRKPKQRTSSEQKRSKILKKREK